MAYFAATGIAGIPWEMIVALHPQVALAVLCDVPVIVSSKTLSITFANNVAGQAPLVGQFAEQISSYSIFAGMDIVIDPTNAFQPDPQSGQPNPFKSISDFFQGLVSGIACTVEVDSEDVAHFMPVKDATPLELIPSALNRGAGWWALKKAENVTFRANQLAAAPAANFTMWATFSFLRLLGGGNYAQMDKQKARSCLKKMGIGCGDFSPGSLGLPAPEVHKSEEKEI